MRHGTAQTGTKLQKEKLMKNRIKIKIFTLALLTFMLISALASENPVRAEAGLKDGTYDFSSCAVTKFQIRNNTLTLKTEKKHGSEITSNKNSEYKSYKLKARVSKNCKYILEYYVRGVGELDSRRKTDYREIKDIIDFDRSCYRETGAANNVVSSYIKVKNGMVAKIVYRAM